MLFFDKYVLRSIFGDSFNPDFEGWKVNRFTLAFYGEGKKYEEDFKQTYFKNSIRPFRLTLLIGVVFYALFFILDLILFTELKKEFILIRFFIVIPVLVIVYLLSFTELIEKYMQPFASFVMYVSSLGIIVMVYVISNLPVQYPYYSGIILVLFFGYTISKIRFVYAFLTGLIIIISYEIVIIFITHSTFDVILSSNFFLLSANMIGMLLSYYLEYNERWNYFLQVQLNRERQKVEESNMMLEKRVQDRNRELIDANKQLKKEIERRRKFEKEKSKLESRLFQLQKMETIGTLAGGIAHEFNNVLTPIIGYGGMLLDDLKSGDPLREDVEQILSAAKQGKSIVQKVMALNSDDESYKEPVSLIDIVREVEGLIKISVPDGITVHHSIKTESDTVLADKAQVVQVLINIVLNALHAMEGVEGKLNISVSNVDSGEPEIKMFGKTSVERYVMIEISDTGIGMTKKIKDRIFEPFFTTKEVGKGTGLGLSVVHGIVKNHKGFIEVESTPGKGTAFRVYLPAYSNLRRDSV